jgi:hypothetical protein
MSPKRILKPAMGGLNRDNSVIHYQGLPCEELWVPNTAAVLQPRQNLDRVILMQDT